MAIYKEDKEVEPVMPVEEDCGTYIIMVYENNRYHVHSHDVEDPMSTIPYAEPVFFNSEEEAVLVAHTLNVEYDIYRTVR
jgi:hypothetical protein